MSPTSATPPATRRIAKSYLTDLIAAAALPSDFEQQLPLGVVASVVEQLLAHGKARHVLRSDQLVLTFDLADDPAGWSQPAAAEGPATGLDRHDQAEAIAAEQDHPDYPAPALP